MNHSSCVAILIPSFNPDSRLPNLVSAIRQLCDYPIILVNDGSRKECEIFFEEAAKFANVILLHHRVNLGKGRALKTGFNDFLVRFPNGIGLCTADGDGQHLPEDILNCCNTLIKKPDSLILGVRCFSGPDVPWKSCFGNTLTSMVFRMIGLKISDTQTGLRGIGTDLMQKLMNSFGERFEFETVMLLDARDFHAPILEIPIQTVYLDNNSETHFNPINDSIRIYRVILNRSLGQFLKFSISGLLSFVIDISLFSLLFYLIVPKLGLPRLITSVAIARACSLVFNYLLNRNYVFSSQKCYCKMGSWHSFVAYLFLCCLIMGLSYYLTKILLFTFPSWNAALCKTIADVICFFTSYISQKSIVFSGVTRKK